MSLDMIPLPHGKPTEQFLIQIKYITTKRNYFGQQETYVPNLTKKVEISKVNNSSRSEQGLQNYRDSGTATPKEGLS